MTSTTTIDIPVDGIIAHPVTGRDAVMLAGVAQPVVFDVDAATWRLQHMADGLVHIGDPVWRTAGGQWVSGSADQCLAAPRWPSALRRLEVAAPPAIASSATALPRRLHFIWIGDDGLPADLATNLATNADRSGVYACTLHAHVETAAGLARLQEQLRHSAVTVNDLRGDPLFQAFQQSTLGPYYQQLLQPATRNAGAASDLLRVQLLYVLGGIYLDCDDTIVTAFPEDVDLLAAPGDMLLNRWIGAHKLGYFGYNQSCFASQPGNPVLRALLDEMALRLGQADHFLRTPRPWKAAVRTDEPGGSDALNTYILRTLHLTGPEVFNCVLERCRPEYYALELWMMHAYRLTTYSPREPRYIANRYFEQMHAALAHYLPFSAGRFEVAIGNADTWNVPPARS